MSALGVAVIAGSPERLHLAVSDPQTDVASVVVSVDTRGIALVVELDDDDTPVSLLVKSR